MTVLFKRLGQAVPYRETLARMEAHVDRIHAYEAKEEVWFLEHPPLYTVGSRSSAQHIIGSLAYPVYETNRGGQITYHGPGQRVAYVLLDLRHRERDVRRYIWLLEEWIIVTLRALGIKGQRHDAGVGVWVTPSDNGISPRCPTPQKIAAIGVRIRKWITFHGISLNINPHLSHYDPIVPCGLSGYGVTSLNALGTPFSLQDVDQALEKNFSFLFGNHE